MVPPLLGSFATELSAEEGAAKIAAHLGLTATGFELIPPEKHADDTEELRELWSELMPGEFEDHTHPIIFLPSLVSAYKAAPSVDGPYHCMLVGVSQSLYFAKFMRSPLGSDLYSFYVDEILRTLCKTCKNCPSGEPTASIVGLLILATYAHEYKAQMQPLLEEASGQLKDWLRRTAHRSLETIRPKPGTPPCRCQDCVYIERAFNNALTILNILDGRLKSEALQLSLTRRETFDRYAVKHEVKMTTRFECARCQTVTYCCKGKEDWRVHKQQCFETAY
ncbi:hypothetical protein B0H17DRAFT_1204368 [Mycena rosella]|uniref:MYND-type domain-containing protein n=1 Tax=Mycena rosella TaxID=1033263 RepID=A0AAD7DCV9_MYCRO|nr:hypothetical protein B0H17DRAFT_1204368 [Mycena rosella]